MTIICILCNLNTKQENFDLVPVVDNIRKRHILLNVIILTANFLLYKSASHLFSHNCFSNLQRRLKLLIKKVFLCSMFCLDLCYGFNLISILKRFLHFFTGMSDLGQMQVRLTPNRTNLGIFSDRIHYILSHRFGPYSDIFFFFLEAIRRGLSITLLFLLEEFQQG